MATRRSGGGRKPASVAARRARAGGGRGRAGSTAPRLPAFPGGNLTIRSADTEAVLALQRRLNRCGCGPLKEDGLFGQRTAAAVRLFQARFPDASGQPLEVDGIVGPLTWGALFRAAKPAAPRPPADALLRAALDEAAARVGVMEVPPGSNRGPEVDAYLRCVGLEPAGHAYAWCAAFVYTCFNEAAMRLGRKNPVVRIAGVLEHWRLAGKAGVPRITAAKAFVDPTIVRPGQIFIIDVNAPGGDGHTGLVAGVEAGRLLTIEGNTNDGTSGADVGVFRRSGRKIADINVGFIDYTGL